MTIKIKGYDGWLFFPTFLIKTFQSVLTRTYSGARDMKKSPKYAAVDILNLFKTSLEGNNMAAGFSTLRVLRRK